MEKRTRVLVVDDRQDNVYFLRALLHGHGYDVVTANHGAEALELSRKDPPSLVIADILMPVMDGFALCREWRRDERLRRIPFVFYTATYTDERDREFALSLGADRFILKPEDPDKLVLMAQELIEEAAHRTQAPLEPLPQTTSASIEETVYLKQYSEALVRKLEAKMQQLEQSVRSMQQDLAARKQAEEALRKSEQKFYKAFTINPVPMAISALDDGTYIDVNDAFVEEVGLTREEAIGKSSVELGFWTPEQREAALRESAAGHPIRNLEISARMKDGRIVPGLFSADPLELDGRACWLTVFVNMTARKDAEQALANEEARRRILVEQSRDGIVVLNQDGSIFEANRKYAEMLGYSPEEIRRLHIWDWDSRWPKEKLLDMLRDVSASGDHFETEHRRKDGSCFPVEISSNGTEIGGRKLVFCVCRDITERREAEDKMKKQLAELRQWYSVTLNREERMMELKNEVDQLLSRLGEKPKYGGAKNPESSSAHGQSSPAAGQPRR